MGAASRNARRGPAGARNEPPPSQYSSRSPAEPSASSPFSSGFSATRERRKGGLSGEARSKGSLPRGEGNRGSMVRGTECTPAVRCCSTTRARVVPGRARGEDEGATRSCSALRPMAPEAAAEAVAVLLPAPRAGPEWSAMDPPYERRGVRGVAVGGPEYAGSDPAWAGPCQLQPSARNLPEAPELQEEVEKHPDRALHCSASESSPPPRFRGFRGRGIVLLRQAMRRCPAKPGSSQPRGGGTVPRNRDAPEHPQEGEQHEGYDQQQSGAGQQRERGRKRDAMRSYRALHAATPVRGPRTAGMREPA